MADTASTPTTGKLERVGRVFDGPLAGLVPWIVLGGFDGPGRVPWVAAIALALSLLFIALDHFRGRSPKLLGIVDVVFFAALLVLSLFISPGGLEWLEVWLDEICNITLTLIAVLSMLFGVPFTIQYARETTDRQFWHMRGFIRVNYIITGVWAASFFVSAVAGFYGDAVLKNSNNLWTGWIIQIGANLLALQFTLWYPAVARSRAARAQGNPAEPEPPLSALFAPLAVWFIPIGILTMVTDAGPTWLGIGFIVIGALLGNALRQRVEANSARNSVA